MAVAGGVFIGLKPGQKQRIYTWKKQGTATTTDGLQTYYGRLGLGSGELLGRGIGSGKEKHFLPQANTDFVFATVGEELGFVGTSAVILLFGAITWAGFTIAEKARDRYSKYLAVGITSWLTLQALVNMLVVTMTMPATGVPLPFLSYGGSSLLVSMTGLGLLLSIAYRNQPTDMPKLKPEGRPA